ncbi:hypothetical protein HGRIS_003614 [Hohenbuehelia grisea]|uniref:Uncharacterized protein n=1 Tax=Hohenbuehelia grisea TaxID=104357 RepID=A0ABR3JG04_9AGAR
MSAFHSFEQSQLAGVTVVGVFALLSTAALAWVAFRIVYLAVVRRFIVSTDDAQPREYVFFHTQLGHYAACLLLGNLCTGIAGLIGFQWLGDKGVTDGPLCTTQGIIMQLGNFTSAYFTIVLAVHTFLALVLRKKQSLVLFGIFSTVGWIGAAIIAFSPLYYSETLGPFYGTSGIGCGIRAVYPQQQFLFHLLPIFATSVISAILYSLVFLVLRGTLAIRGGLRLSLGPRTFDPRMDTGEEYHRFVAAISRSMLWFPIAYIVLLMPYAVVRMLALSGFIVPFEAVVFAYVCWFVLGFVDVLLLYNTFRVLQPAIHARSNSNTRDMESFGGDFGADAAAFDAKLNMGEDARALAEARVLAYRYPEAVQAAPSLNAYSATESNSISIAPPRPPRPATEYRPYSVQSGTSSIGLLIPKTDHKYSASTASVSTQPALDRSISPISELSNQIVVNAQPSYPRTTSPNSLRPPPLSHQRLGSTDSLASAPSRASPSPAPTAQAQSGHKQFQSSSNAWADVSIASPGPESSSSRPSHPVSRNASITSVTIEVPAPPRYQTYYESSSPTEEEISSWLSRQKQAKVPARDSLSATHMASSASPMKNSPLLSAVASQTSFPSPTLSYYHTPGTPSSATSPRPLPPLPTASFGEYETGRDNDGYESQYGSPPQGGLLVGSPPVGHQKVLTQKPSMSAFGVRQSSGSTHSRRPSGSANGHARNASTSSGRYF